MKAIIEGILLEEDLLDVNDEGVTKIFTTLKPLITYSTAEEVNRYLSDPTSDGRIVSFAKRILGNAVERFQYAQKLRAAKINSNVAEFNLYNTVSEYTEKGLLCGYPVNVGLSIIDDLLTHRQFIVSRDAPATKEEFGAFKDAFDLLRKEARQRLQINKTRVYDFRSSGTSTYLGVIVSKMDDLSMASKGVQYLQYLESAGLSAEGGSQF